MQTNDSGLPKYFLISQEIVKMIQKGRLLPGMKVPSENEIINKYHVSNTTARKVLQEIEKAGYAIKIKGKGTFVQTRNVGRSATRILGFTRNMLEAGYKPETKVLNSRVKNSGYSATINNRWYVLNGPVLCIKRLRFADQVPMMLEERYISIALCPDIEKLDFSDSLYDIYEKKYNHKLTEVNQMLSTVIIDETEMKKMFKIEDAVPAFRVDGVTFIGKELILEMEQSYYRGDKYQFAVRAK